MEKITFCIPSKSNLRYLKSCIPSIRENSFRKDHEILIFVDSDEDGTIAWLEEIKDEYNIKYHINPDIGIGLYGIGRAYDFLINKSITDIFIIFHADMILGKHADLKSFHHLKPNTVVCSTRIEPPIHPNNGEKILMDLGMYPEVFKKDKFNSYVEDNLDKDKITNGIFAPWMMYKKDFEFLGGHDPRLKSCREDSDIFNRMKLAEYNFIQPWNSLVYHFTGRGAGSFSGDPRRHKFWGMEMEASTREFIRKWGSTINHSPLMEPIITPKYNIGIMIKNCTYPILEALEPFYDTLYIDESRIPTLIQTYIYNEREKTSIDLNKKIYEYNSSPPKDEIIIKIDGNKPLSEEIFILPKILPSDIGDGTYKLLDWDLIISKVNQYQNSLIHL